VAMFMGAMVHFWGRMEVCIHLILEKTMPAYRTIHIETFSCFLVHNSKRITSRLINNAQWLQPTAGNTNDEF
jgi:hypothetical protein